MNATDKKYRLECVGGTVASTGSGSTAGICPASSVAGSPISQGTTGQYALVTSGQNCSSGSEEQYSCGCNTTAGAPQDQWSCSLSQACTSTTPSGTPVWEYGAWGACSNNLECKQSRTRRCKDSVSNATLPNSSCPMLSESTTQGCPQPNFCPNATPSTGEWKDIVSIYCVESSTGSCYSLTKAECKDGSNNPVNQSECGAKPSEASGQYLGIPPFGCNPSVSVACWMKGMKFKIIRLSVI